MNAIGALQQNVSSGISESNILVANPMICPKINPGTNNLRFPLYAPTQDPIKTPIVAANQSSPNTSSKNDPLAYPNSIRTMDSKNVKYANASPLTNIQTRRRMKDRGSVLQLSSRDTLGAG